MTDETAGKRDIEKTVKQLGLVEKAAKSFVKLCELGCEARMLGEFFYTVSHNPEIRVSRKKAKQEFSSTLRSLDSYDSVMGGLNKKQIKILQETLKEAAETMDKLNRSSFVSYLKNGDEMLRYREVLHLSPLLIKYSEEYIPFLLEKSEQIGAKQRPHFKLYMNFICSEVKEKTGKENYKLICDVLNGIGIAWDVDALKQWRSRNKPFWER